MAEPLLLLAAAWSHDHKHIKRLPLARTLRKNQGRERTDDIIARGDAHIRDRRARHPPHPLKSKSGMEAFPNRSGAFLCLLESGDPPAFWLKIPNRVRLSTDSRGRIATATGKLILKGQQKRWEGETTPPSGLGAAAADSQLVPLDVVEEVLVGPDPLGLDGLEQVLPVVGERAHQVVLLITVEEQPEPQLHPTDWLSARQPEGDLLVGGRWRVGEQVARRSS